MLCLGYTNVVIAQNTNEPKIDSLEREIEIQKKINSLEYELLLLKNEPVPIEESIQIRRKRNAQNGLGVGVALTSVGIPFPFIPFPFIPFPFISLLILLTNHQQPPTTTNTNPKPKPT